MKSITPTTGYMVSPPSYIYIQVRILCPPTKFNLKAVYRLQYVRLTRSFPTLVQYIPCVRVHAPWPSPAQCGLACRRVHAGSGRNAPAECRSWRVPPPPHPRRCPQRRRWLWKPLETSSWNRISRACRCEVCRGQRACFLQVSPASCKFYAPWAID